MWFDIWSFNVGMFAAVASILFGLGIGALLNKILNR